MFNTAQTELLNSLRILFILHNDKAKQSTIYIHDTNKFIQFSNNKTETVFIHNVYTIS